MKVRVEHHRDANAQIDQMTFELANWYPGRDTTVAAHADDARPDRADR